MRKAQVIQLEGSRPIKAVNCILTFEDNACYCNAAISHAQYGCHAISIRKMLVTKQECQTAYETKTFIGHSYNITGIVVNQPKVTDLIVKGSLDKASIIFSYFLLTQSCLIVKSSLQKGYCSNAPFVGNKGEILDGFYLQRTVTLLVQEHRFWTEPGVLSKQGHDLMLPHGVRVPAEDMEWHDPRFGTYYWNFVEPGCAKEGLPVSTKYNEVNK